MVWTFQLATGDNTVVRGSTGAVSTEAWQPAVPSQELQISGVQLPLTKPRPGHDASKNLCKLAAKPQNFVTQARTAATARGRTAARLTFQSSS